MQRVQQSSHDGSRSDQIGETSRYQADGTVASVQRSDPLQRPQDDLLQVADDREVNTAPAASAIWDWEAPSLENHDSSWYYEPQGELLTADRNRNGGSNEFTIPENVPSSGVIWSPHNPLQALHNIGQSSRLSLLASSNTAQATGTKRKAAFEHALLGPDPKRAFKGMPETDRATDSRQEDLQSAPSTHAQGASARAHSAAEPTRRPMHGPLSPRRTLTDPSTPMVLPARKVFPIQIGDKLFRLSGASISSDGKPWNKHMAFARLLTLLEHPRTSPSSSRSSCARVKALTA